MIQTDLWQDQQRKLGDVNAADDASTGPPNQAPFFGLAGKGEANEGGQQDEVGRVSLSALFKGPSMQLPLQICYQSCLQKVGTSSKLVSRSCVCMLTYCGWLVSGMFQW